MAVTVLQDIAREIYIPEAPQIHSGNKEINLLPDSGYSSVRSSNEPLKDGFTQTV